MVCVLVLKDGPEKCAVFHEEDVKKRVVELGYITEEFAQKSGITQGLPVVAIYMEAFKEIIKNEIQK